ncbi:hypothetical protein ATK36_4572 [Amycolatopsis sulphurea]|uniref:Preprotein translocase subunit SecG n=1 Tax=Amycolatopsis sulphurea TaxID=76022 RepID=A0A2A9FE36_9PSEU|nr:hypothetical protein [Amycolatopsis sulphurea]PFG49418.1 hypothetical protein ATK36_4572 [Amycolatopsis sulphurea]
MSFGVPAAAVLPLTASAVVLAQQPGNGDNGGQGEDFGKSSPVGLLLLILFLVAVAFLIRSMTKHLKRVPASFDPADETPAADQAGTPAEPQDAEAGTPEKDATAGRQTD